MLKYEVKYFQITVEDLFVIFEEHFLKVHAGLQWDYQVFDDVHHLFG